MLLNSKFQARIIYEYDYNCAQHIKRQYPAQVNQFNDRRSLKKKRTKKDKQKEQQQEELTDKVQAKLRSPFNHAERK